MVMGELTQEADVVVIGGGPGGYAAAFRAADLGLDVTLIDTDKRPGGVCLFRGCIPSKTYLHLSEVMHDADRARDMGITYDKPKIDLKALRAWKDRVVDKLSGGLAALCEQRGVQYIQGRAEFVASDRLRLRDAEVSGITFEQAIIATGSRPIPFPGAQIKKGGRVMNSTGALGLPEIPESMLVLGGGYVGLELGMVYSALGTRIQVVEMADQLLPGVDPDLVKPLKKRLDTEFEAIHLKTKVSRMEEGEGGVQVSFEGESDISEQTFDRVLIAIGRSPNSQKLGLDNTKVEVDDRDFIQVDDRMRTADPNIFAIGDVIGGMMLAHKASREGKIAAEVIAGEASAFDAVAIPAVVYTDPQIAWCGLTETEAKQQNREVRVQRFPWKYSGRAVTMGVPDGLTKLLIDPESERVLGVGIVGRHAEGLISEGVLAVEMAALAEDVAYTIHPHPTLSETEAEAAEIFLGGATHVPPKKK